MRVGDEEDWQSGNGVATDGAGNVVLAGQFQGSVDFGGGTLANAGKWDVFVAKLGPDGEHIWSVDFGDAASYQSAFGVTTDGAGNVVLTGDFYGSVDFGGGVLASAGWEDIFVAKLGPGGEHIWSKRFGDGWWGTQSGHGVATDAAGSVFVTGAIDGGVDFGGGELIGTGWRDIFVAKFGPSGNHLWSKRFGDQADWQSGNGVATDAAGNVALTGTFEGSVDFGGGMLASAGGGDVFVAKLGPSGNHLWSKRFGDVADGQDGTSIATDGAGNVVLTGTFEGSIDFGGGSLTSAGGGDVFVAKLGSNGDHIWSKRFGDGWDWQSGHGVATDGAEDVFVTGTFRGAADFGCGTLASAGWGDIFVAKLGR